ncbi:hypothetical protein QQP08_020839, partial [Theobroma cacao]
MNLKGCKAKYLQNYSHMAYTSSDNRGRGSVWALWFHHLIDYRQFQSKGQDLFVKSWLYGTEYAIDGLLSVKSDLFSFDNKWEENIESFTIQHRAATLLN